MLGRTKTTSWTMWVAAKESVLPPQRSDHNPTSGFRSKVSLELLIFKQRRQNEPGGKLVKIVL